jgi:hypothetical protein
MKQGDIVYHVAHPTVQARVFETPMPSACHWISVEFAEPVEFATHWRKSCFWQCSRNLLHVTSQMAQDAHDPNHLPGGLQTQDFIDTIKYACEGYTHVKLQPIIHGTECDHEWVTWTGLKGTITDCTKCKKEQK